MACRKKQRHGDDPIYLAEALRRWRENKGLLMKQAADELDVSEVTWWRWENRIRFPSANEILRLSDFLRVPLCRFFYPPDSFCPSCKRQHQ